jgi:hypothetical protein
MAIPVLFVLNNIDRNVRRVDARRKSTQTMIYLWWSCMKACSTFRMSETLRRPRNRPDEETFGRGCEIFQ